MKKTTKRLVIFLLSFVMLLSAIAIVVSASGASVPASVSETQNGESFATKYGEVNEKWANSINYPFLHFKYKGGVLEDVDGYPTMGTAIQAAKNYQDDNADLCYNEETKTYSGSSYRTSIILLRRDYMVLKAGVNESYVFDQPIIEADPEKGIIASNLPGGDKYNNFGQMMGEVTIDLNGYTLTQEDGAVGIFGTVTNKGWDSRYDGKNYIFKSIYTVINGNIKVKDSSVFYGNMWNDLYFVKYGNGYRMVPKGESLQDFNRDGINDFNDINGDGVKDENEEYIKYVGELWPTPSMADKDFVWNFNNVNFSYAEGATKTDMLMSYTTPQSEATYPPVVPAPFYFNYNDCTFDLANAPENATLFNINPGNADNNYCWLSVKVKVTGCEIKTTEPSLLSLDLYSIAKDSNDPDRFTIEFAKDANGDHLILTVDNAAAPADINASYLGAYGTGKYWKNVDGKYSLTIAIGKDECPAVPIDTSYLNYNGKQLYWHLVDGNYLLAECVTGESVHACSCGKIYTDCTDADDDKFCDECGAEHLGEAWLPWQDNDAYPFVVLRGGNYYGKYNDWAKATADAFARSGSSIIVRRDYRLLAPINPRAYGGEFTIDLRGHALTRITGGSYFIDNWWNELTTADDFKVTVKNGTLVAEDCLICLSGHTNIANSKRADFAFENVTFKLDSKNMATVGWVVTVHNQGYNKPINSDLTFTDCIFDITDMSNAQNMDNAPILNLDVANKQGIDYIKVDVTFYGGKIISNKMTTNGFIQSHKDDTVIFNTGNEEKYMTLELPEGVVPYTPVKLFVNDKGENVYFHGPVIENGKAVYTVSACRVVGEGTHNCSCGYILEDCIDKNDDDVCDVCLINQVYIRNTYGAISIDPAYANVNEFPFLVLKKIVNPDGEVVYTFMKATRTMYGRNGGEDSAIGYSTHTLLSSNNKYDLGNKCYVPLSEGGTVVSAVVVLRRDYSVKYGNKDTLNTEYFDNLAHAQGEVIIDLAGHTLSEDKDSISHIFPITMKSWMGGNAGVYTFPSTYTFKNGNVKVMKYSFAKIGTWDFIEGDETDGKPIIGDWHFEDSSLTLNLENINFGFAEGATATNLAYTVNGNASNNFAGHGILDVKFEDCVFDLVTNAVSSNVTVIDNNARGKDIDADVVIKGCDVIASDMSKVTIFKTTAENGTSTSIAKNANGKYITVVLPNGTPAPALDGYSIVNTETDATQTYYTLAPTVIEGYVIKTNVTLYTSLIYNLYIPKDKVKEITLNGVAVNISNLSLDSTGYYYHLPVNVYAPEILNGFNVSVKLYVENNVDLGTNSVVELKWNLSIFKYANSILNGKYSKESKTLMNDMLIYAYTAHNYFGTTDNVSDELAEIKKVIESHYRKLPTGDGLKYIVSNFDSATLSLDGTPAFRFYLASGCTADKCKFYFNRANGTKEMIPSERIVSGSDSEGNNYVEVRLPAYEMLTDIGVSYDGKVVGAYNLYSYHRYVQENRDLDNYFKLVAVVEGLMKYSASAKEYRDYMVGGGFGSMDIDAPETIYPNCPGFDITPLFSNGSYYGNVTWTTSHQNVYVENGKIYAVGNFANDTTVSVTATTEHHEKTVYIKVAATDSQSYKYIQNCYSDAAGGAITSTGLTVKKNGENITGEFAARGKLAIYAANNKVVINGDDAWPHIQFRFSSSSDHRMMIKDNDNNGIFQVGNNAEKYDINKGTIYLDWAVIVKGTTASLYVNGVKEREIDVSGATWFNLGALHADVLFYDVEIIKLDENTKLVLNYIDTEGGATALTDKNGAGLRDNYTVSGKVDIYRYNLNAPHLNFQFNSDFRFILWDHNNNGIYVPGYQESGKLHHEDDGLPEDYDARNKTLTLDWMVIVDNGTAYWYINGELVRTLTQTESSKFNFFKLNAHNADVLFYDINVVAEADDEAGYNALVEEYLYR